MAYNPYLYMPYGAQQFPQVTQPVDGMVWVDGMEGVRMYQLPPNSRSPVLMFKNEERFAVKTTDAGGASTVRLFKFEEETQEQEQAGTGDYVTRDDFESFKNEILEAVNGKPALFAE